ncbi:hypothetical protein K2X33_14220 [bacterium]|nr:hypothetical protein [bacterium]
MRNRGQASVGLSLGLSVAMMAGSFYASRSAERAMRENNRANLESLKGFYSLEITAWHSWAAIQGNPSSPAAQSRQVASMPAAMPSSTSDTSQYAPGSYTDGTPLGINATRALDPSHELIASRSLTGMSYWSSPDASSKFCGAFSTDSSSGLRNCLSVATVAPPSDPPVWNCPVAQRNYGIGDGPFVMDGLYRGCAAAAPTYNIEMSTWGLCPSGMAPYGLDDGHWAISSCAPLPNPDILTGPVYNRTGGYCAANEIIVGGYNTGPYHYCQAINTARYRLGEQDHVPQYYSASYSTPYDELGLPVAIAYGFQRIFYPSWPGIPGNWNTRAWDKDGCVNLPYGALNTYKNGKYCNSARSRVLQYIGAPGDPPFGTPVKMFPDCSALTGNGVTVTAVGGNTVCEPPLTTARPNISFEVTKETSPYQWVTGQISVAKNSYVRLRWNVTGSNLVNCFLDGPSFDGWSTNNGNWRTPQITASTSFSLFCHWRTPGRNMNGASVTRVGGMDTRTISIVVP